MTVTKSEEATNDGKDKTYNEVSGRLGIRHLQVVLLFLGMIIGYCLRVSMSEMVVAMSDSSIAYPGFPEYDWGVSEKSQILSAFFWGYTVMQVPSGLLTVMWSSQKLLSLGMLICGVLNLLTPFAAEYGGSKGVFACRVGMGLAQGCLLPCVHTLLSKWAPPSERARLGTFAYAGAQLGTVIAFPISGFLAGSKFGWPSVFYLFGALAVVWSIGFFIFGADTPSSHSSITDNERQYIEGSLRAAQGLEGQNTEMKLKTPWKEIFTSAPMWALIIAHCGQNWGFWMLLTEIPLYMNAILEFNIQKNGGVSALPYLAMWLLSFPASWLSDYALKRGISRAVARKVSNTIAHWGPALALIALALAPSHNPVIPVTILVITVGLNAGSLCGFQINHIDLSPNYAGTMMSITNCIASVMAIAAPSICGKIISDETNINHWNRVFFLSAAIYFVGNLVFIIFGKAEVQWWNNPETVKERKEGRKQFSMSTHSVNQP